jgi:signal transduction histidine kinase
MADPFRLKSIGTRLVLFALLCAVPAVVFALLQLREDLRDIRARAMNDARMALERLQARLTQQLAAAEVAGHVVGSLGGVVKPGPQCDAAMLRAREAAPFARNFFLVDMQGRIFCGSASLANGLSVAHRLPVRDAMRTGRPVLGDFGPGVLDDRPALMLAVPVPDADRRIAGIALTVFDAPSFTASIAPDDRLVLGILDRQGVLISRSLDSDHLLVGRRANSTDEVQQLQRLAAAPLRTAWLDERERLYVSRAMMYRGQHVFWGTAGADAHALERDAFAHLATQSALVLLVTAGIALLAVLTMKPLVTGRLQSMLDERTRELALVNEELESFSSTVSHDLRAPVAVVRTFSQVLLEKNLVAGKDLHHLERIKAAGDNMNELIAALLDLARYGRAKIEPRPVDLSHLAREVAQECRDATGRDIEVHVAPGCTVMGDAGLLRVVLSNLLANAWKFTRDAPSPRVDIEFAHGRSECVVTVRDNGAGFDEAYAARLFQPFQRLHSTREFPGIGIGLATVHRIVQIHGGRIWASGEVGRGARFHFALPDK